MASNFGVLQMIFKMYYKSYCNRYCNLKLLFTKNKIIAKNTTILVLKYLQLGFLKCSQRDMYYVLFLNIVIGHFQVFAMPVTSYKKYYV